MNVTPSKTEFTDDEHREIRLEIARAKSPPENLTEAAISRESGVSASTLNSYLKDSYKGDNNSPAAQLHKWLSARRRAKEFSVQLPVAPAYQPLVTSQRIMNLLAYAHAMGRIVVVAGSPGLSKTATARQFAADTPRSWHCAMDPATAGVSTMLSEILRSMGEPEAKGTPQQLSNRVSARMEEAKCLLMIDEAQHLGDKAIEQVRAINDRARARGASVGIALIGNEAAYSKIGTTGTKAAFAQVSSRVAMRRYFIKPDPADVETLAHAWGAANREVMTRAEVNFLQQIAEKPGGLRNVEMTIEAALMAARGSNEPLQAAHLKGAYDQLSGLTRAA
ncbi:MAG TPA: AAA family ATPase [Caulobacteraceae bacterium]|nr:AAA family ATPase [Caulobacteraceae bacterium]